jgi:peroxiredoxin
MLALGTKAPPFCVSNQFGRYVRLADFAGFLVLLWFYGNADPGD